MSARDWADILDGFVFIFAQPIYYALAVFVALMILAPILQFSMVYLSDRNKSD